MRGKWKPFSFHVLESQPFFTLPVCAWGQLLFGNWYAFAWPKVLTLCERCKAPTARSVWEMRPSNKIETRCLLRQSSTDVSAIEAKFWSERGPLWGLHDTPVCDRRVQWWIKWMWKVHDGIELKVETNLHLCYQDQNPDEVPICLTRIDSYWCWNCRCRSPEGCTSLGELPQYLGIWRRVAKMCWVCIISWWHRSKCKINHYIYIW